MTDKELMQQALKKLEFFAHMKSVSEDTRRLIAALRERLAKPEQEMVPLKDYKDLSALCTRQGIRLMELEDAQPEQEPVNHIPDTTKMIEFDLPRAIEAKLRAKNGF